eukprot:199824-Rhodomonas_salina.2
MPRVAYMHTLRAASSEAALSMKRAPAAAPFSYPLTLSLLHALPSRNSSARGATPLLSATTADTKRRKKLGAEEAAAFMSVTKPAGGGTEASSLASALTSSGVGVVVGLSARVAALSSASVSTTSADSA